jgi:hypothetical protein
MNNARMIKVHAGKVKQRSPTLPKRNVERILASAFLLSFILAAIVIIEKNLMLDEKAGRTGP